MGRIKKFLCFVLGVVMMFAFISCGEKPEMGLSLYLAFDEKSGTSAVDSSKVNPDGKIEYYLTTALYKTPEEPRRRPGVKGTALWFDGWSTYLVYDEYVLPESFTISVWVAPRSWEYPDGQISAIAGKYNRNTNSGFLLGYHDYGSWSFSFGTGDRWIVLEDDNNKLERFTWTHIAASFDAATGKAAIYKNGDIVNSVDLGIGVKIQPTTESLTIGKNTFGKIENDFQTGFFNGLMDELKIYDHALDRIEIEKILRTAVMKMGIFLTAIIQI